MAFPAHQITKRLNANVAVHDEQEEKVSLVTPTDFNSRVNGLIYHE